MEILASRFRRRQLAQDGIVLERFRRDGEFVHGQTIACRHLVRDEYQQRVEVHGDKARAVEFPVDVVGQAARTGAEHQYVAQLGVVVQHRPNLLQRRLVFFLAPGPVTMDVRIIGVKPLVDRQPRPECQVGFVTAA